MDKHKQYNIPEDEEPMIVSEPSAAYGADVAYGDTDVLEDWDLALFDDDANEEPWDPEDPEIKELLTKVLIDSLEQIERGECCTLEEAFARRKARRLCR